MDDHHNILYLATTADTSFMDENQKKYFHSSDSYVNYYVNAEDTPHMSHNDGWFVITGSKVENLNETELYHLHIPKEADLKP